MHADHVAFVLEPGRSPGRKGPQMADRAPGMTRTSVDCRSDCSRSSSIRTPAMTILSVGMGAASPAAPRQSGPASPARIATGIPARMPL